MELPSAFIKTMKDLLGENYPAYQDSFRALPAKGLRVNELKISVPHFLTLWEKADGPELTPIPFVHNGFFFSGEIGISARVLYHAGLYYIQEPAAMVPAEQLPVAPGEYVLDLCAAPGGKSTALAEKMKGKGLLYANDISVSRAKALKKNLEMHGAINAFVTAEEPQRLAAHFPAFFDKILIDAPCSGEGMFRVQPQMVSHWMEKGPAYYMPLQAELLETASQMLAPGGMLLYSTCTFSPGEDEEQILAFLDRHPEFTAVPMQDHEGFSHLTSPDGSPFPFIRLYPHLIRGEGQFAALLNKGGEKPVRKTRPALPHSIREERYLLPESHLPAKGLHYLMTGLHRSTIRREKELPTQSFALASSPEGYPDVLNLSLTDRRCVRYLKGETIELDPSEQAPTGRQQGKRPDILVCVEGFPLGFGRKNGFRLKNGIAAGWRMM